MGDLMGWGTHCAVCNQIDYLPFQCSSCNGVFCAEHRTQAQHDCPRAAQEQGGIVVCPICAKAIHVKPGQSPDAAFESHSQTECDPANYNRVHNKQRCPVQQGEVRCKEKLTEINSYRCKNCGIRVCLKHRMPDDHQCQKRQAEARRMAAEQAQQNSVLGKVQNMFRPAQPAPATRSSQLPSTSSRQARTTSSVAARAGPRQGGPASDPSNTVKGTAHRRMQAPPNPASAPEMCPQCSARFATVEQLIVHVDQQHTGPSPQGAGHRPAGTLVTATNGRGVRVDEVFRCPHCNHTAPDPAQLVAHVERCQQARNNANASKGSDCTIS